MQCSAQWDILVAKTSLRLFAPLASMIEQVFCRRKLITNNNNNQ